MPLNPEWLFKIFGLFKTGRTDEFKAITASYKELNQEYRIKIEEQENRIKQLEQMKGNLKNIAERETLLEDETTFHREYISLITKYRDAMEELYFLRYELKHIKEKQ